MTDGRTSRRLLLGVLAGLLVGTPALATNGMYLAGYGAEAAGRGGANIAIADRALGLQSNPAGIAQLQGNHLSVDLQFLMPDLHYGGDAFGNDIDGDDLIFAMPSISYVRGGAESHWTWGIGLVSQGGMGATFEGYNTPFGTTNEKTYSQVRFATLVPTVAYAPSEDFSIGLSVNLGYSDVAFDFWPNTAASPFFAGMEMTDPAKAFNYSFRGGLMFRVHPMLQFGLVYQTETKGEYKDGTLVLNFGGPLGKVAYDVDVDGFTWPEQLGFGMQLRPTEKLMLAFDIKNYFWSRSLGSIEVKPSNPDNAMAPPAPVLPPFVFNWKDQLVAILGLEYRLNNAVTLRAGYNKGNSPVPDATLTPLFPAIVEDHATLGLGWNLQSWTINAALERGFEASQTNSVANPMLDPFAGSTVSHSQWTLSLGFTKVFSRKKAKGGQ